MIAFSFVSKPVCMKQLPYALKTDSGNSQR